MDEFESFMLLEHEPDTCDIGPVPEDPFLSGAAYEDCPFSYATEEVEAATPPSSVAPSEFVDFDTPFAFDETTRPADDADALTKLMRNAERAVEAGFQIAAIGQDKTPAHPAGFMKAEPEVVTAEALKLIRAGKAWGYRLELGLRGKRPDPNNSRHWLVPLAIEWEGKTHRNDDWLRRWNEAMEMLPGTSDIWALLDAGVVHATPSGGGRWFFEVPCANPEDVVPKGGAATRWAPTGEGAAPQVMAELLTRDAVLAPSWGKAHPTRRPYTRVRGSFIHDLPRLEASDVDVLVALLDLLSDAGVGDSKDDLLGLTSLARQVRNAFNSTAAPQASLDVLLGAGWRILRGSLPDEVSLVRPNSESRAAHAHLGGADRRRGQVSVWTTSEPSLPQRRHDAFSVFAHLQYGGDADVAARELAAKVPLPVMVSRATERPEVNVGPDATSTHAAQQLLQAVARSEVATAPGEPMVLRLAAGSSDRKTLLINRPGMAPIAVDDKRDATAFLMRVAQPILGHAKKKDSEGHEIEVARNAHSIPEGIRDLTLQDAMGSHAVPAVMVVAAEPVLLESGRTISEPGFHRGQQVLITTSSRERAQWMEGYAVPEHPTRDQAQVASDLLREEVFGDFPFMTAADQVRAVAMLLTMTSAHLMPKRPGWMIEAPSAGTGKSLCREVCTTVSEGTRATIDISPFKRDDIESEKLVAAGFLAGRRTVSVDNAPTASRATSLLMTTMLTAEDGAFSIRRLGVTEVIWPTGLNFVISGNRIELGGDLPRRFIPIYLEAGLDRLATDEREFRHPELVRWAEENRPMLLAATHTVVAHGLQNPIRSAFQLPSFEVWARIIGGALTHLTVELPDGAIRNAGSLLGEGRPEWTADNSEDAEIWGDLLDYLAREMARKGDSKRGWSAKEIIDAIWAGPSASYEMQSVMAGIPLGPLEEHLRFGTESTRLQKVGRALTGIARERVAFEGSYLVVRRTTSASSKKATRYAVDVYQRDTATGRLVQLDEPAILARPNAGVVTKTKAADERV